MTKELAASKNIRDRVNRHNVCSLLTKISERIGPAVFPKGMIVFAGVDEYGASIMELLEPVVQCTMFYYNCGNKFIVDRVFSLFQEYSGSILFANGDECRIYEYLDGTFVKKRHLNGNLIKRHKKGGQSSVRFARLAEESRHVYVTRVIDCITQLPFGIRGNRGNDHAPWRTHRATAMARVLGIQ